MKSEDVERLNVTAEASVLHFGDTAVSIVYGVKGGDQWPDELAIAEATAKAWNLAYQPAIVLRVGPNLVKVPESGRDLAMARYVGRTVLQVARETQDINDIPWVLHLCGACAQMVATGTKGKVTVEDQQ
jgi:hypothetical protein